MISFDTETDSLNPRSGNIHLLVFSDGEKSWVEPDRNKAKALLESGQEIVMHNAKFDLAFLHEIGIHPKKVWCTLLAEQIINAGYSFTNSLKDVLQRYGFEAKEDFGKEFTKIPFGSPIPQHLIEYALYDVKHLLEIRKEQEVKIDKMKLRKVLELEFTFLHKLLQVEKNGVEIDVNLWKAQADKNLVRVTEIEKLLPKGINWNAPAQIKTFLQTLNIELNSLTDLKTGEFDGQPFIGEIRELRETKKALNSFGMDWLEKYVEKDGRVHSSFRQIVNTGRVSSRAPNMQQLPKQGLFREAIKGNIIDLDFGGQELGIMAAASGQKSWIKAMLLGHDIHGIVASQIFASRWKKIAGCKMPFKCDCKEHKQLRSIAKTINFAMAYGAGVERMAAGAKIKPYDMQEVLYMWQLDNAALSDWLDWKGNEAFINMKSYSADNYRRLRLYNPAYDGRETQGKNFPIQSAGAQMTKRAINLLRDTVKVVNVVHDSIAIESNHKKELAECMQQAADEITGIANLVRPE